MALTFPLKWSVLYSTIYIIYIYTIYIYMRSISALTLDYNLWGRGKTLWANNAKKKSWQFSCFLFSCFSLSPSLLFSCVLRAARRKFLINMAKYEQGKAGRGRESLVLCHGNSALLHPKVFYIIQGQAPLISDCSATFFSLNLLENTEKNLILLE